MMKSIKLKLMVATTTLIVVLLAALAFVLISQEERKLNAELFEKSISFVELSAGNVVELNNTYLQEGGFVFFQRELFALMNKNSDLLSLLIVGFNGEVFFDSNLEKEKRYSGEKRFLEDLEIERMKSRFISVKTKNSGIVYVKRNSEGRLEFVDKDDRVVGFDLKRAGLVEIAVPVDDFYRVIFYFSDDSLRESVALIRNNILLLALLALLVGGFFSFLLSSRITSPILKVTSGAQKIALGDFKTRIDVDTGDETAVLAKTFNQMAQTLEVTTKAMLYEERVRKELELAAKIQRDILPKSIPAFSGLDVSAGLLPAEEIGGDCYDFIEVGDGKWIFYLGDVTGHGVPAGIVVSITNAIFYALAHQYDLHDLAMHVNRVLQAKTSANMFLTLVLFEWDEKTGRMRYLSCGHEPVLYYKAKEKKLINLGSGGIALGMLKNIESKLEVKEVNLEKDDFLVLYSDGIPEAWKNKTEMYGMERFSRIVYAAKDLERAHSIRNAILADVKQFAAGYKQMDDVTLMVIKRKNPNFGA
jgi:serine phosphatase RsbU (regulator of sigma subunit)